MALIRAERSRRTLERWKFHKSPTSLSNEQLAPLSTLSMEITHRRTYRKPLQQIPKGCRWNWLGQTQITPWVLQFCSGTKLARPWQLYPTTTSQSFPTDLPQGGNAPNSSAGKTLLPSSPVSKHNDFGLLRCSYSKRFIFQRPSSCP